MTDAAWARVKAADEKKSREEAAIIAKNWPRAQVSEKGARYVVRQSGGGNAARPGQTLTVRYAGRFLDGRPFASSADEGRPVPATVAQTFDYVVGRTRITPALDEALLSMRKGEKRTVIAQGPLAYGNSAFYSREKPGERRFVIPPQTTLVYEVEVMGIR